MPDKKEQSQIIQAFLERNLDYDCSSDAICPKYGPKPGTGLWWLRHVESMSNRLARHLGLSYAIGDLISDEIYKHRVMGDAKIDAANLAVEVADVLYYD